MPDRPAPPPVHERPDRGVLLVTGGGRGIGAATCRLAAAEGWRVVVNFARDAVAADGVVAAIRAAGGQARAMRADVGDEAQLLAMFARIDAECGAPLAGLVNNAGVVDVASRVDAMSVARLERQFRVNVIGSIVCAREAVRRMRGHGGAIVNLSSAAARLGAPGQYVDYAASKGAIDTFTIGLAREVAAEGIRVNAVRPGIIDTEIHASGGEPDRASALAPTVPMRRAGTAEEVAQAIVWLLSPASGYTTGAIVDVAGGR